MVHCETCSFDVQVKITTEPVRYVDRCHHSHVQMVFTVFCLFNFKKINREFDKCVDEFKIRGCVLTEHWQIRLSDSFALKIACQNSQNMQILTCISKGCISQWTMLTSCAILLAWFIQFPWMASRMRRLIARVVGFIILSPKSSHGSKFRVAFMVIFIYLFVCETVDGMTSHGTLVA